MRVAVTLFALTSLVACQQAGEPESPGVATATPPDCSYDAEAMLAMDVEAFDATPDEGWRTVANVPGCEAIGADLIVLYRKTHGEDLSGKDEEALLHHEFQLRAAAQQTGAAIDIATTLMERRKDDPVMRLYHEAERAFLSRDLDALTVARDQLAALPAPEGFSAGVEAFKAKYPDYPPPVWPVNLDVVEGFIACFDKPYAVAYTFECRPG